MLCGADSVYESLSLPTSMRSDRHLLSGARRATPPVTVSTRITHADKTFSQSAPKAAKDLQLILLVAKAIKSYILHYTPKAKESTRSYRRKPKL